MMYAKNVLSIRQALKLLLLTYRILFPTFLVIDDKHASQDIHSFVLPSHAQEEFGALQREEEAEGTDGTRRAEDQVQKTPGIEVDAKGWYVVRELQGKHWDGYYCR